MKKIIVSLLAVALVAGVFVTGVAQPPATLSAAAETQASDYRLSVSGEGVVSVTPDIAYVNIGVETEDADASVAQTENAKLMTSVKNAIMKAGVKEDDMQTMNYSIYKTSKYFNDKDPIDVYRATNTLKVTVRDLDDLGDLIDVASKSGANQINSIRFTVEDEEKYYQEALVLAMENAKGKASAILGTMNKKPGMPVNISESSFGGGLYRESGAIAFSAKADMNSYSTPIQAGDIEVSANVSVEYDYSK